MGNPSLLTRLRERLLTWLAARIPRQLALHVLYRMYGDAYDLTNRDMDHLTVSDLYDLWLWGKDAIDELSVYRGRR